MQSTQNISKFFFVWKVVFGQNWIGNEVLANLDHFAIFSRVWKFKLDVIYLNI